MKSVSAGSATFARGLITITATDGGAVLAGPGDIVVAEYRDPRTRAVLRVQAAVTQSR